MFAIIRTRWQTRPLSCRARRRSSAAPGSLRKKYAGIVYPPNMVRLPNHYTTSGNPRKPVLDPTRRMAVAREIIRGTLFNIMEGLRYYAYRGADDLKPAIEEIRGHEARLARAT